MYLIKEYLASIEGVYVFAVISMLIFLVTFLFMVYHTYSLKREDVRNYSRLPLEDDQKDQE